MQNNKRVACSIILLKYVLDIELGQEGRLEDNFQKRFKYR